MFKNYNFPTTLQPYNPTTLQTYRPTDLSFDLFLFFAKVFSSKGLTLETRTFYIKKGVDYALVGVSFDGNMSLELVLLGSNRSDA